MQEAMPYEDYHRKRFRFLRKTVNNLKPNSIFEVAPITFTNDIRKRYDTDTIGYAANLSIEDDIRKHYQYDFLNIIDESTWPVTRRRYDLVIATEIIEHLPLSLNIIFRWFKYYMKPNGYLIIQTPNAVALKKRIAILQGRNPYELMTDEPSSIRGHNHIREYTLQELISIGKQEGLTTHQYWIENYFWYKSFKAKFYQYICYLLPSLLKDGVTIIYKNGES